MTQTDSKVTNTFIAHKGFDTNYFAAFGDLNGPSVDGNGNPTGKTLLESARAEYEKALKNGATIEHTGIFGPQGSREIIQWNPDIYIEGERIRYSEWHKDGNRVRGTLAHKLTQNGEETIVSSKKTFRVDE